MTQKTLINTLAARVGISPAMAKKALRALTGECQKKLERGEDIFLGRFATIRVYRQDLGTQYRIWIDWEIKRPLRKATQYREVVPQP